MKLGETYKKKDKKPLIIKKKQFQKERKSTKNNFGKSKFHNSCETYHSGSSVFIAQTDPTKER